MVDVHGKFWNPGSSTAAQIRAIYAHPDIKEHRRKLAVRAVSSRSLPLRASLLTPRDILRSST